ncbi:hypothetical protein EVG20_g36 [Dentipellis fragilis]|uniref:O-methyltransferase domain-containing protein n=1 Tax=Dentipellis fragilis TaxID=205917 RepID=A0A4Y9ZEG7_9AGAM|nr:hypothetical protein EVG20_g36 [Dentipellis fragilis]
MASTVPDYVAVGLPTTKDDWNRSDLYHNSFLISPDESLEKAIQNSNDNGLPEIAVSAAQGKLLNLLAKSIQAKRILEVGTLGGYSTIWLARALPEGGQLLTCELEEKHARVAQQNVTAAGVADKVKIAVGPAADTLVKQHPDIPYDLAFIDADKPNNLTYFIEAKRLVRSGGVIIVDNVVRNGIVSDPSHTSPPSEGVRALLAHLKNDKDVECTTIATVGEKGYDGFLYSIRK